MAGLNCQNCVRKATTALQSVPGIASAVVSLEPPRATVRWRPEATPSAEVVVKALGAVGFEAKAVAAFPMADGQSPTGEGRSAWSPLNGWQFNVAFGGAVTLVLMLGEWGFRLGMERWFQWVAFALALPVQVMCGARFYVGAWRQLRVGSSNMDTLVSLGSTTAFGFSTWALLTGWHGHLYFMEAAAIISLISVGHWMEARMSAHAASSLKALLNLAPQTARRLDAAGAESEVPVAQLQAGDRIALRPGDRVPVDGEVLEGQSAVDEAMLTGESLPVEKTPGAKLFSGTVNQNGRLVFRVTATGDATALAQIIAVVQRAQSSRANIQKLGDQVSAVFVPIVVLVALGTGLWWGLAYENALQVATTLLPFLKPEHFPASPLAAAFTHAAGVLIVACPCAMGLATPAAIMAGVNAAARRGILIRDGGALEKSGRITAILFDKTGTLTEGKLAVAAVQGTEAGRRLFSSLSPSMESRLQAARRPDVGGLPAKRLDSTGVSPAEAGTPSEGQDQSSASGPRTTHPLTPALSPDGGEGEDRAQVALLGLAAELAAPSSHPLSKAIAAAGSRRREEAEGANREGVRLLTSAATWREVRGAGIEATQDGVGYRLGSLRWLSECGVAPAMLAALAPAPLADGARQSLALPGADAAAFVTEWTAQGATVLGLSRGTELLALFALRDQLKAHAAEVVAGLQQQGKTVFLVTGDNAQTAAAIAGQAGIAKENVFAEIRPEQKAGIVQQLQGRGERVAFVGDGINDAPALEQADLGIAVARASDVAREAADIILLDSDIQAIPDALGLAQATLRTIKQNLFWALFYNAAAIPLASLGLLSPVLCAAAMGLSDVVVIGNALRLRGWKR